MVFMNNLMKWYKALKPKQFVLAGVFMLALATSIGLGFANRIGTQAATPRDDDTRNSIDGCRNNGGIGAENAAELIKDIQSSNANNCVGGGHRDLATIYSFFGLTPDKYNEFIANAKDGTLFRDGRVEVEFDGKNVVVMTGVKTVGRTDQGDPPSIREPFQINGINGKTFYRSTPDHSFADHRQSLPVMVLFDNQGVAKIVIMNSCGNPTFGTPKTPAATCKTLTKTQPDAEKKPNTYKFGVQAEFRDNATFSRAVFTFSDGTAPKTITNLNDQVEHTFTKDAKVTVTVYARVPGGGEIQAPGAAECEKQIKYIPPFYVCEKLMLTTLDEQKRKYRFTVIADHDQTTTLKDADFTVDGTQTTTGVVTKDGDGNIYKEYAFNDEKDHVITAVANFNTTQGLKSDGSGCKQTVKFKKEPKCEVPGKEHLPPNHPDCGYCKPGIPKGDDRCKEIPPTPEMPKTGPGSALSLFAGTSALGFAGHKLYQRRRNNKRDL